MNNEEKIKTFRNKGNTCFKNKNFSGAILYYKEGLQLDAKNPHLNGNLAQAYLEQHDFVSAEYYAKIAIANAKESAKGYFRAAKASAGQGDTTKAIKYLKEGIECCSNSNTEDLRNYLQTLYEEDPSDVGVTSRSPQEDLTGIEDVPSLTSDSDSDDNMLSDKLRSRSTSRMPASASFLDNNKTSITNQRSVSMSRTSNSNTDIKTTKLKKKQRRHVETNPFIATLESIKKEMGVHEITPEQFWSMQRNELQSLLKEGSEIMARGLARNAVEKYKAALDMILDHSLENFRMKEIDLIVLKYALCIGWIELASYGDIVKAVKNLRDIEDNHVSKFPAVYYGLGSAYYKLNRYKVAVEHLEKGLLFLNRGVKFEVLSWPGTNDVIPETTRNGLEEVLKELLKTCRAYREPDAICRYSQCRNISSHIIPSEYIFYSDPDFCGYVIIVCEEKCRIEYHLGCWKDYKEAAMSNEIGKLSDKDFIGRSCPTTDCVTQANERSAITKIEIVGGDATVKTSIEAPKIEATIKESKKTKKKKNEKSTEVAAQDKPKSKLRPKIKKTVPETMQTSQEAQATSSAEELARRLDKLNRLRDVNFGFTDNDQWNPRENYYGREDILRLDHFLSPEITEESEAVRGEKEFIFSYFYEFIRSEGPQKIIDLELKWQNEVGEFEGVKEFMNSHANICSFLLQSYRFAAIDDYMCLAEQLADTYNKAKTELVESLSFTLNGFASHTESVTDMSQLNNNTEMLIEYPTYDISNLDPKLKSAFKHNVYRHVSDKKSAVETALGLFADKPLGSTSSSEAFIPHAGVDDLFEDPDISTAEDDFTRALKRDVISPVESITCEGEMVDSSDDSYDDSDEVDSKCDEVEDDDGEEQEGNQNTQKEKTVKNQEEENGKVEEEEQTKGKCSPLERALYKIPAYSQRTDVPPVTAHSFPVPGIQTSASPVLPSQQLSELSDSSTLRDEIRNFKEKISILESAVKKLEMDLAYEKNEKEDSKNTSDLKLEQLGEKIKELELERTKVMEEKNQDIKILKEKLSKKEEECEAEKAKFEEVRREKEMSEANTKEIMRNLISETGQKVKELEEELEVSKRDMVQYQHLLLKANKEAGEMQIKFVKQKCLDVLEAMRCRVKYLTDSSIPTKMDVAVAVENWKQYLLTITEHEIQFMVHCTSLNKKLGNFTLEDFIKLEWPSLPQEPSCPLNMLEEMMLKALDEREDLKGKLIAQDKEIAEMKVEQEKVLNDLTAVEEQRLRLRKAIEERREKVANSLTSKEPALKPGILEKVNEVAEKLDLLDLKGEAKVGKEPEHLVQSEEKGLKQNINLDTYLSAVSVNSPLQVNPVVGLSMYQYSTPNYGHQPLLHSSPYFYTGPPMYTMAMPIQQGHPVTNFNSAFQPGAHLASVEKDKPSAQQQTEPMHAPSFSLTEVPKIPVSTSSVAEKSQPPLETKAVPEKKKSLSLASGLTPIVITKTVPTPSTSATVASQGIAVPAVAKSFSGAASTVGISKQKLPQMSNAADAPKPLQMSLDTSAVEPNPNITSAPKPKTRSNFQKLMEQLRKHFPTKTDDELASSVAIVRERNDNSLTGLTVPSIINMVNKVLKDKSSKKQGTMGLDKFGGTAWGEIPESASSWSKSNDNLKEDCIICFESMEKDLTSLHCKHSFHTKCIRQWLRTESVCPVCRLFTRMVDEFPPLS